MELKDQIYRAFTYSEMSDIRKRYPFIRSAPFKSELFNALWGNSDAQAA